MKNIKLTVQTNVLLTEQQREKLQELFSIQCKSLYEWARHYCNDLYLYSNNSDFRKKRIYPEELTYFILYAIDDIRIIDIVTTFQPNHISYLIEHLFQEVYRLLGSLRINDLPMEEDTLSLYMYLSAVATFTVGLSRHRLNDDFANQLITELSSPPRLNFPYPTIDMVYDTNADIFSQPELLDEIEYLLEYNSSLPIPALTVISQYPIKNAKQPDQDNSISVFIQMQNQIQNLLQEVNLLKTKTTTTEQAIDKTTISHTLSEQEIMDLLFLPNDTDKDKTITILTALLKKYNIKTKVIREIFNYKQYFNLDNLTDKDKAQVITAWAKHLNLMHKYKGDQFTDKDFSGAYCNR